jgi:ATP-dependent Clp protease ATP-binding subunit ClpC
VFERYTEKARRVIFFARDEASQFGSSLIETEHLLLSLLREDEALSRRLGESPLPPEAIRKRIEERTPHLETATPVADIQLSNGSKRILAYAAQGADRLGNAHIGTEHLLLGVVSEKGGFAAKVLSEAGIKASDFRSIFGRTRIPSWRTVQPPATKPADYVKIHGGLRSSKCVREHCEF